MKLCWVHFRFLFFQTLRQPSYVVSTLIFPALFFLIFAHPNADTPEKAHLLMGSFSCFAILGVMFLQFGVNLSHERASQWHNYMKTLPLNFALLYFARACNALAFALISAAIVVVTVNVSTEVSLTGGHYAQLGWRLVIGSIPFALMGLLIGFFVKPQSSLPIANLVYLLLSFAGGLWMPPNILPERIRDLSEYLPTRYYGEIVWSGLLDKTIAQEHLIGFGLYTIALVLVAVGAHYYVPKLKV